MASIGTLEGFVGGCMAEKKISKGELAQLLGFKTTQTLNTKLDGSSELSLKEAKSLAEFCGVTIEDIAELAFS